MKKISFIVSLVFLVSVGAYSQNNVNETWDAIQPDITTCGDIMRLLEVSQCDTPSSTFRLDRARIHIVFWYDAEKPTKKLKVKTVTIGLKRAIRLADYEDDLTDYEITDTDVVEIKIYTNRRKGLQFEVAVTDNVKLIRTIHRFPLPKKGCKRLS